MNVDATKTIVIDPEHSIEFGQASWDPSEKSIRRRKNNPSGRFDPFSSSEIPIDGHVPISELIVQCLRNDLIDRAEMARVFTEIMASGQRQGFAIP
jgi:hypothetical protein